MELTEEQRKANKKAYNKKWREENKEQIKEYDKKWREENKEKIKEYQQTPKGQRINRISNWKSRGMIEPDGGWDKFMEMVENTKNCELCNITLTVDRHNTSTTRCVDHSHITNLFRNIVCHSCNVKLPQGT